jgi:hypothetical protein
MAGAGPTLGPICGAPVAVAVSPIVEVLKKFYRIDFDVLLPCRGM